MQSIKVKSLMSRLLEAGYPRSEMYHHYTDLYVYATPLTTRIIEEWCEDADLAWDCFVTLFKDQQDGRLMYDIAFQYDPAWERCE